MTVKNHPTDRWRSVTAIASTLLLASAGIVAGAAAATAAQSQPAVLISTSDGSTFGFLDLDLAGASTFDLAEFGTLLISMEEGVDPEPVEVTAVEYDPVSGDYLFLITTAGSDTGACGFIWVDGVTGEPDVSSVGLITIGDVRCTGLDLLDIELVGPQNAPTLTPVLEQSFAQAAAVQAADSHDEISLFIVTLENGEIYAGIVSRGGDITVVDIEDLTLDAPIEAIAFFETPGFTLPFLPLAGVGNELVFLGALFEFDEVDSNVTILDLGESQIRGLDIDENGTLWMTVRAPASDSTTVYAVPIASADPGPSPSPSFTLEPNADSFASADARVPLDARIIDAVDELFPAVEELVEFGFGEVRVDGAVVAVDGITAALRAAGEAGDGNELADTGSDSTVVTTLVIVAAVLGGLGVLILALRIAARRRVR